MGSLSEGLTVTVTVNSLCASLVHTAGRRNVSAVAFNRDAKVPVRTYKIVGRIECHPLLQTSSPLKRKTTAELTIDVDFAILIGGKYLPSLLDFSWRAALLRASSIHFGVVL
jgi:hypothetical protein